MSTEQETLQITSGVNQALTEELEQNVGAMAQQELKERVQEQVTEELAANRIIPRTISLLKAHVNATDLKVAVSQGKLMVRFTVNEARADDMVGLMRLAHQGSARVFLRSAQLEMIPDLDPQAAAEQKDPDFPDMAV